MRLQVLMPQIGKLIPYEYEQIKTPMYEDIIEEQLSYGRAQNSPYFLQISGIPGAGKSAFSRHHKDKDALYISFDKIMEQLPDYQNLCIGHLCLCDVCDRL